MGLSKFIKASAFAAEKHKNQRRKDVDASPYINHPIALCNILSVEGGVQDVDVLCAAMLHDTIEDTETTRAELALEFGEKVASIVQEVTNPEELPKDEQKQWQIDHASSMSVEAKQVKLADKIANLRDILDQPPASWSAERKRAYFDHADQVAFGLMGTNEKLEDVLESLISRGYSIFDRLIEQEVCLSKPYQVISYDAYDAPPERTDLLQGGFDTLEEAVLFAKKMIDDEVALSVGKGKSLEEAVQDYKNFGEIPMVLGDKDHTFHAYDYLNSLLNNKH